MITRWQRWREQSTLQEAIDSALLGDMEKMQKVIEMKISLDLRIENSLTPLEIAAEAGATELVAFLLEAGADPKVGGALLVAAFRGWIKIYNLLFNLVSQEDQIEASMELPKGIIRRAKADSDPDYDWDD
jgi:ankyrin repeat protein